MERGNRKGIILMVGGDHGDYLETAKVMEEHRLQYRLDYLRTGRELMDYLGHYSIPPFPSLILLNVSKAGENGFDILEQLNLYPEFNRIPVIVLAASRKNEDAVKSYSLGATAYLVKPGDFGSIEETLRVIERYIPSHYPADHWMEFPADLRI